MLKKKVVDKKRKLLQIMGVSNRVKWFKMYPNKRKVDIKAMSLQNLQIDNDGDINIYCHIKDLGDFQFYLSEKKYDHEYYAD